VQICYRILRGYEIQMSCQLGKGGVELRASNAELLPCASPVTGDMEGGSCRAVGRRGSLLGRYGRMYSVRGEERQ
jgi:hypothetical protein